MGRAVRLQRLIPKTVARIGAAMGVLAGTSAALANGVFPSVSQLVADPTAPDHLVLRSTFGLILTSDRGANWDWLCEEGMGYANVEPPMAVLPGGTILLAVPGGVSRSDPTGCDFTLAAGISATVVDLSRVPAEPASAIAVSLSASGTDSALWWSSDAGVSFAPLGDPLVGLFAVTVDVAPTNPDVIYVSGLAGTEGALLRSGDRGTTFATFGVPETTGSVRPYIAAVDPRDENTVYVRTLAVPAFLEVTHDGGASFTTILATHVPVQGFALSPDGLTAVASNTAEGTFRASTKDLAFEQVACSGPSCLMWSDAGLFACGDNTNDGYIVGRSQDQGRTFQRVLDLSCIRDPLTCDSATSIGSKCPEAWPGIELQIGATQCQPPEVPSASCDASGGTSGTGATGGSGGSGGAPAAGAPPTHAADDHSEGCGCRVGRAPAGREGFAPALLLAWLVRRRRQSSEATPAKRNRERGSPGAEAT